tara:strand:- start:105 stop:2915 length:2811 start_codon:yes stop_codon:yes gene_type:complete
MAEKINKQDLFAQVRDMQRERRRYAARRGAEQLRRTGAGLMGQTSQQILAGAPAEFQGGMSRAEKMKERSRLAEMMGNLSEIEANLAKERSVSRREMSRNMLTMAGNLLEYDLGRQGHLSEQQTAKITGEYQSFQERMKALETAQRTDGFYGRFTDSDEARMQANIREVFKDYVRVVTNEKGETVLTNVEIPMADGSSRTVPRPLWEIRAARSDEHVKAAKDLQNFFIGLSDDQKILFRNEFSKVYGGVDPLEWLLPTAPGEEAHREHSANLAKLGIDDQSLGDALLQAERQKNLLIDKDRQWTQRKQGLIDDLENVYVREGAKSHATDEAFRLMRQVELAEQDSPQVMWSPPPEDASLEEKRAYIKKEMGEDFTISDEGHLGVVGDGGSFIPAQHQEGGPPVVFDEWATAQRVRAAQGAPQGTIERGRTTAEDAPSPYTATASDYIETLWEELNQPEPGTHIEEFIQDPSFIQWMKDMNYGDESSSELDKRWAARQLIKEARISGRERRGDRREIRDRNIVEGKAVATEGQMKRAKRRLAAVQRRAGETGTDSAQVAATGAGGDAASPEALPATQVTEGDAAGGAPQDVRGESNVAQTTQKAQEPVEIKGTGGYTYRHNPDGSVEIVKAPKGKGVGTVLTEGVAYDAIMSEIADKIPQAAVEEAAPVEEAAVEAEYDQMDERAMDAGLFDQGEAPTAAPVEGEAGFTAGDRLPGEEDPLTATERGEGRRAPGLVQPTVGAGAPEYHTGSSDVKSAARKLLNQAVIEKALTPEEADTILKTIKDPGEIAQTIILWARDKEVPLSPEFSADLAGNIQTSWSSADLAEPTAGSQRMLEAETGGEMVGEVQEEALKGTSDEPSIQEVKNREAVYRSLMEDTEEDPDDPMPKTLGALREKTGQLQLPDRRLEPNPNATGTMKDAYETKGRARRRSRGWYP